MVRTHRPYLPLKNYWSDKVILTTNRASYYCTAPKREASDVGGSVVLDYCAAVRGILNDDQGGPLHPPGLRMAEALGEVRTSLDRSLAVKRGDSPRRNRDGWPRALTEA
jgi:hypothetical protein